MIKYHGQQRIKNLDILQDSDLVITTYSTLALEYQLHRMDQSPLHRIGWYRVVLDEGQYSLHLSRSGQADVKPAHIIRRPSATFHQSCAQLHAESRWCLTGTPIQNKLGDLGALLSFIRAKPFEKASIFRRWIETAFELTADDPQRVKERLILILEAFCLRRTRAVLELPPLRQIVRTLSFSDEEKKQYDNTQGIMMRTIKQRVGEGQNQSTFGLFQANMQLRILCNHGTWQKPFSWLRCSNRDQREAMEYTRGSGAEFCCSGCRQPMPILGSNYSKPVFEDQCNHLLCSECIDQSTISSSAAQRRRCPVCVNTMGLARGNARALAPARASSKGAQYQNVSTPAAAPVVPALASNDLDSQDDYFNAIGHSTKMQHLVTDLSKDLWRTKRWGSSRSASVFNSGNEANVVCSIIFSCWTRTLNLVAKHLEQSDIPYRRIDGNTTLQTRQKNLEEFASGDREPVLIMTTGTGAFGYVAVVRVEKTHR